MNQISDTGTPTLLAGAAGYDPIEDRLRENIRATIEANMGGESSAAWAAFLQDLDARGLKRPEFVIVDGAPGSRPPWSRSGATNCRSSGARCTSTAACSAKTLSANRTDRA